MRAVVVALGCLIGCISTPVCANDNAIDLPTRRQPPASTGGSELICEPAVAGGPLSVGHFPRSLFPDRNSRLLQLAQTDLLVASDPTSAGVHHHSESLRVAWLLTVYCALIVGASLIGGWLPSFVRLTHLRMQFVISMVGGLMLGIAVFHLLPHALVQFGPQRVNELSWSVMLGMLTMFFLLRTFHFHHHGTAEVSTVSHDDASAGHGPDDGQGHRLPAYGNPHGDSDSLEQEHAAGHAESHSHDHQHGQSHNHHQHHGHQHSHGHHRSHGRRVHGLSWAGMAMGLGLHTLFDGLALAASVQSDVGHSVMGNLLGLGTFLAILLHKPLDAVSITSLMSAGGWSTGWRNLVNLCFAMMCPLGAALFIFGMQRFSDSQSVIVGCALAFSAGVFLCISLGDLLPEMELHSHHRVPLTSALLVGILIAWAIGLLEGEHVHVVAPVPLPMTSPL